MALFEMRAGKSTAFLLIVTLIVLLTPMLPGQPIVPPGESSAYFWPLLGICVAVMLSAGRRYWPWTGFLFLAIELFYLNRAAIGPGFAAGVLPVHLAYYATVIAGVWMLRQRYPGGIDLQRLTPDLRDFVLAAAGISLLTAAWDPLIGAMTGSRHLSWQDWMYRFSFGLMSIVVIAPLLLAWDSKKPGRQLQSVRGSNIELALLFAIHAAALGLGSSVLPPPAYVPFPVIWLPAIWAVLRFDLRILAIIVLAIAIHSTMQVGREPSAMPAAEWQSLATVTAANITFGACAAFLLYALLTQQRAALAAPAQSSGPLEEQRQRVEEVRMRGIIHELDKSDTIAALASTLAHDWNNLLLALSMEASRLRDDPQSDSSQLECLGTLEQVLREGSSMTEQLTGLARRDPPPLEAIDLHAEVRRAVRLLEPLLPGNVSLATNYRSGDEIIVNARMPHLHLIVLTLGLGARDAIGRHDGTITISITGPGRDQIDGRIVQQAKLVVSDDGREMRSREVDRAFDPLFMSRNASGVGLRLAVVRNSVTAMNGSIDIESGNGDGTTVTVTLPITSPGS